MYGGRVAMGKEMQREERWIYANRSGNRENGTKEQQADRSNGDLTRDIFPHFGGLVFTIRWGVHLYKYSVTAQRAYSVLNPCTRLLMLLCFKSRMSSSPAFFPIFSFGVTGASR